MESQELCLPIANLCFLFSDNINIDEKINSTNDLKNLIFLFKFKLHLIKINKESRIAYPLEKICSNINIDNIDEISEIIMLGLQIQDNDEEFIKIVNTIKIYITDNMIRLKLFAVLFQISITIEKEGTLKENLTAQYFETFVKSIIVSENKEEIDYLIIYTLPKYIKIYKNNTVLLIIWKEVEQTKDLYLVTGLIDHFILCETLNLLMRDNFWNMLQEYFSTSIVSKYKIAMYLFKVSIDVMKTKEEFSMESGIISFNKLNKIDYFQMLHYLCILLDVCQEKQLHLIEPSLPILYKINSLHSSWLNLIYKLLLRHPNNTVVYNTLLIIMKSSNGVFMNILSNILAEFNKTEYSIVTKQAHKALRECVIKLDKKSYKRILIESLKITWVPVAFWSIYNSILAKENLSVDVFLYLEQIMKKCKELPHKYIRKGFLDIIFHKLQTFLTTNVVNLQEMMGILLEFLNEDQTKYYSCKLINSNNLIIDNEMLVEMVSWLNNENTKLNKIDLMVEVLNRKNVSLEWIKTNVYMPFLKRDFNIKILDRLTYLYVVKLIDCKNYLLQRLDIKEDTYKICHIDKPYQDLLKKCNNILMNENNCTSSQLCLAFEILFYSSENNFIDIFKHWINKILNGKDKIESNLAIAFLNLLSKIPSYYIKKNIININHIVVIYEHFFSTQPNDVILKMFHNMDLIFENIDNKSFINECIEELNKLRRSEYYENAVRNFVRSISVHNINKDILQFILSKLFELSESSETVAYYFMLYFKCVSICDTTIPKHEYLTYGYILSKEQRAEYEICLQIHLEIHLHNPYFRIPEIHKWALEDILFDRKQPRINNITLALIDKYKIHFGKRYFPDSMIHLQKLRIMQTFAFIVPYVTDNAKHELIELVMESFCIENHQTSIRQLMQYILVQLIKHDENRLILLRNKIESTCKTQVSTITGFIPVIYSLEMMTNDIEFSINVIECLLVWTMGAHFKLRLFSQITIEKICGRNMTNRKLKLKFDSLYKSIQKVLQQTIIENAISQDLEIAEYIHKEQVYKESNQKALIYLISVRIPELSKVTSVEWEYFKIKKSWSKYVKENLNKVTDDKEIKSFEDQTCLNIQKKMIPWKENIQSNSGFILVASLIDSPANLGGLSRTCEIFGVKEIVLHNVRIVGDKDFQSLSMSSERWLNYSEVKVGNLVDYLLKFKDLGYRIIGAEQTSQSIFLNCYQFMKNTILLLGNEKTGIPPNLLPLIDDCIEIPQFGMIRSLNVHVAGAMVIWEYSKQHLLK